MKIAVGSDHGGLALKEHIKKYLLEKGVEVIDHGTFSEASCDYPDFADKLCSDIVSGTSGAVRGILFCGTGIGISIAANKMQGIRAALCGDVFSAKMSREHNDANVLCLGGRVLGTGLAEMITDAWLETEFAGGRHARRVEKVMALERH
ncbi:MAG: ribose 5-phosphate isomerase B [Acidaminococcaceae bacterium]|nr:ribose 5-phosphate isomerase B [Acidaminococcaceae bacterium]